MSHVLFSARLNFEDPEKETHVMTHQKSQSEPVARIWVAGLVVLSATFAGCSSEKTTAPAPAPEKPMTAEKPAAPEKSGAPGKAMEAGKINQTRVVGVEPGVAGGTIEETSTLTVKVIDVDRAKREVTLGDDAGNKGSFIAGPEIRNLDQLHPGDTVTATLIERLVIFVRSAGDKADATYAAALARAPQGAKPGALMAEGYELVALVTAIDTTERTADLKFADDSTRTVKVRPDVDMARYKVGDSVIIRVTSTLSLLASKP
jgi:hypothetical protein